MVGLMLVLAGAATQTEPEIELRRRDGKLVLRIGRQAAVVEPGLGEAPASIRLVPGQEPPCTLVTRPNYEPFDVGGGRRMATVEENGRRGRRRRFLELYDRGRRTERLDLGRLIERWSDRGILDGGRWTVRARESGLRTPGEGGVREGLRQADGSLLAVLNFGSQSYSGHPYFAELVRVDFRPMRLTHLRGLGNVNMVWAYTVPAVPRLYRTAFGDWTLGEDGLSRLLPGGRRGREAVRDVGELRAIVGGRWAVWLRQGFAVGGVGDGNQWQVGRSDLSTGATATVIREDSSPSEADLVAFEGSRYVRLELSWWPSQQPGADRAGDPREKATRKILALDVVSGARVPIPTNAGLLGDYAVSVDGSVCDVYSLGTERLVRRISVPSGVDSVLARGLGSEARTLLLNPSLGRSRRGRW